MLLAIPCELCDIIISEVFQPCVLDLDEWIKKLCIKYPDKEQRRRMDGEERSIHHHFTSFSVCRQLHEETKDVYNRERLIQKDVLNGQGLSIPRILSLSKFTSGRAVEQHLHVIVMSDSRDDTLGGSDRTAFARTAILLGGYGLLRSMSDGVAQGDMRKDWDLEGFSIDCSWASCGMKVLQVKLPFLTLDWETFGESLYAIRQMLSQSRQS